MVTSRHLLMVIICAYATHAYGMWPSHQLMERMTDENYQPTIEDEKKLVNMFTCYTKQELPVDELPTMMVAASAFLSLFNPDKQDKAITMEIINDMLERYEDHFHAKHCAPDQQELTNKNKQQITHHLNYSPFIYRDPKTTLFAESLSKNSLKKQFDEFNSRKKYVDKTLSKLEQISSDIQRTVQTEPEHIQSLVQSHVTLQEPLVQLKLARRILEHNKKLSIERMKSIEGVYQSTVKELESSIKELSQQCKTATDDKEELATQRHDAFNQLIAKKDSLNALQQDLQEAEAGRSGFLRLFSWWS